MCVTDPVRWQAIQEQLSSRHLSCSQLVLQSLNLNTPQTASLISTHFRIEKRQTFATLWDREQQSMKSLSH